MRANKELICAERGLNGEVASEEAEAFGQVRVGHGEVVADRPKAQHVDADNDGKRDRQQAVLPAGERQSEQNARIELARRRETEA